MQLPHLQPYARCPLYFFTTCTAQRRHLLANDRACNLLTALWRRSENFGWFVGRYMILPDHVHFFARPSANAIVCADWLKAWKSASARVILRQFGIKAPVWQRDYFDHFIRSAKSYSEKWHYVRENPVRAGFVSSSDDWPWQGVIHDLTW